MQGDGDGWTRCAQGHTHWGRYGAAGLLVRGRDDADRVHVLLQHRAPWSHDGDTWGLPGGARDSMETAPEAALREAAEEAGLAAPNVAVRDTFLDDHGGWAYTTVVADADGLLATVAQRESVALRWVAEQDVAGLRLHPGFARTWPYLRAEAVSLVVDAANVMGARPDGWWRDRAAAAGRLLRQLADIGPRTVRLPEGAFGVIDELVAVVEGQARAVPDVPGVRVVRAAGSGDDAVVDIAAALSRQASERPGGSRVVVVTADRGLRVRLPPTASAVGPRWLLSLGSPRPR